ncbi:MAG: hypothetical protein Q4G70_13095 [Pseudomonadota bacterium]|nr:hypothetical protein [Pseudomonadota bacterium]
MSFAKTERGRAALRNRAEDLSAVERQILIVSNGHRDEKDLATLMCRPVDDEIDRLIALGYLARTRGLGHADFSPTGTLLDSARPVSRPRARAANASGSGGRAAPPSGAAGVAASQASRSMAGAKMYLLGLLSLQRVPEAMELAVEIHTAATHEEFLDRALHCLLVLTELNGSHYARRVARKLGGTLPAAHVPTFLRGLQAYALPEVVGAFIDEASSTLPTAQLQRIVAEVSAVA